MAKRKAKKEPVILSETFLDDEGIERRYNKPYTEKFTYNGDPHVFLLIQQADGHIIPVRCKRDVLTALREAFVEAGEKLAELEDK